MTVGLLASLTHVLVVVHHTLPIQLQRSAKVKDLALILLISLLSLCHLSRNILSNRFATLFFTHNHLMRCSSSVANPVAVAALTNVFFTSLLIKNI